MTTYEIAKLFKELGGKPKGTHSINQYPQTVACARAIMLVLPTEQECRELMESLLPDGRKNHKLHYTHDVGYWVGYWKNCNGFCDDTKEHGTGVVDTPSEAYLLAAKWLKEQQAPKIPKMHIILKRDGVTVIDSELEECEFTIAVLTGKFEIMAEGHDQTS